MKLAAALALLAALLWLRRRRPVYRLPILDDTDWLRDTNGTYHGDWKWEPWPGIDDLRTHGIL